jgi:hypothetical protein
MDEVSQQPPPHSLVIPYLSLRAKPQAIPPEMAAEIAGVLIEWGAFETAIDLDLDQLRNWPIVRELSDEVPRNFDGKLRLWNKSIQALFFSVPFYKAKAREICRAGRIVAKQRNRLIHGLWQPDEKQAGTFRVLSGFDRRMNFGYLLVDIQFVKNLHADVRTMSSEVYSFLMTRMMHAAQGQLVMVPRKKKSIPSRATP